MTPDFHANYLCVEDIGEYLLVGFADQQFETREYLMLQRAHRFTDPDRKTGMAEVHIERNDQGCSGYGGIEQFELLPDRVRVCFDSKGTRMMNGTSKMEITFNVPQDRLETLRAGLCRCFEGFDYYVDHSA